MGGESSSGNMGWTPVRAHKDDLVVLSLQFTLVFLNCMSPSHDGEELVEWERSVPLPLVVLVNVW